MNHQAKASTTTGRRLGGIDAIIPGRIQISRRAWLRLCDSGAAPWGIKLGARRLWDLDVVDAWIKGGCKRFR